jgi:tetratricopeptide (TPR) repeat protein
MKRISEGRIILVSLSLLAIAVVVFFATGSRDIAEFSQSSGSAASAPSPSGQNDVAAASSAMEPNSENVNHAYRQQVRTFEDRIREDPSDTTAMRELGNLLQDAHQNDESARWYRSYLELSASSRQVRLDLAAVLAATGDLEGAREAMLALLGIYPDDARAQYNMGAISANLGRTDEARSWWEKVASQSGNLELKEKASRSLAQLIAHSSR